MIEHIIRTERATLNYRLLAVVVVALFLYLRPEKVPVLPAVILLVTYLAYLLLLGRIILPHMRSPNFVYGMALVDTVALSVGLFLAGGPQGSLFFLFPLFIVYHSVFMGYRTALFSAITFSLAYAVLNLLTSKRIDPIIAVQIPFLFLVAILAGYLSARRLEERREKEDLQEFIRVYTHAQNLLDTARALVKSWGLLPLIQEIALHLTSILGLSYSLAALWDKENQKLISASPNPALEKARKKKWEELVTSGSLDTATIQALETGIPVIIEDSKDGETLFPIWAKELQVGSLVVVPLRAKDEKMGVVYVFDFGAKHSLGDTELKLAQSYAELAAEAVSNAQLHEKAQLRIQQLAGELESSVQRMDRLKEAHRKPQMVIGELHLDGVKERAYIGSKWINLSPIEFKLLYVLAENVGQAVNQETLLRRVWKEHYQGQGNVVDVSVHRLRRKLEGDSSVQRIITVRGRGYMLIEKPITPQPSGVNSENRSH